MKKKTTKSKKTTDLVVNDTKSESLMDWYLKKTPEEKHRFKKIIYGKTNGCPGLIDVLQKLIEDLSACSKGKFPFSAVNPKDVGKELIARYLFILRMHSNNHQCNPIFLTDNIKAITGNHFANPSKRLRANERDDILAAMVADVGLENAANMTQREIKNRVKLKYNVTLSEKSISRSKIIDELMAEKRDRKRNHEQKSQPSKRKMSDS